MKYFIITLTIYFFSYNCYAQTENSIEETKNNFVINILNPSLDYEWAIGKKSILSTGIGIGLSGAYRGLTLSNKNEFTYIITPFIDIQYKYIYNRNKRVDKGKSISFNSGNFLSFRAISRGNSISGSIERTDSIDFAIGPTWGIQRSYGKFRLLFDIGPQYYFDTLGNAGFFPFMIQVNLGFNISKR
ncbi:MAG: hypothetical protein L3J08_02370 [Flavobacteriaceae bacterium]|nr:hypothetical protein [Flavobacteriaceae bacterium]